MTVLPDWVTVAFQPLVTRWLPAKLQDTTQPLIAGPLLVTRTSAVKPVLHPFGV